MSVASTIEQGIREALPVDHLEVINESSMHNVPPDSETHFKLVVVSGAFADMPRVRRHQHVYGLLEQQLAGPVHALSLHLWTPAEWRARDERVQASPQCRGGSRHDPEFGQ